MMVKCMQNIQEKAQLEWIKNSNLFHKRKGKKTNFKKLIYIYIYMYILHIYIYIMYIYMSVKPVCVYVAKTTNKQKTQSFFDKFSYHFNT